MNPNKDIIDEWLLGTEDEDFNEAKDEFPEQYLAENSNISKGNMVNLSKKLSRKRKETSMVWDHFGSYQKLETKSIGADVNTTTTISL